jgi:hypothetical protein
MRQALLAAFPHQTSHHHRRGRRRRRPLPAFAPSGRIACAGSPRWGSPALAVASFAALRSGDANVAMEAFHFVEHGVLTLLFFRFGRPGPRWEAHVEAALARRPSAWLTSDPGFVPARARVARRALHPARHRLRPAALPGPRLRPWVLARAPRNEGRGLRQSGRASASSRCHPARVHRHHLSRRRDRDPRSALPFASPARACTTWAPRTRSWAGGRRRRRAYGREDQYEAEARLARAPPQLRQRDESIARANSGRARRRGHENLILELLRTCARCSIRRRCHRSPPRARAVGRGGRGPAARPPIRQRRRGDADLRLAGAGVLGGARRSRGGPRRWHGSDCRAPEATCARSRPTRRSRIESATS